MYQSLFLIAFYKKKEVYQRNSYCSVTGVYLEVKDIDLASNFLITHKLRPTAEYPNSINSDIVTEEEKREVDDNFES